MKNQLRFIASLKKSLKKVHTTRKELLRLCRWKVALGRVPLWQRQWYVYNSVYGDPLLSGIWIWISGRGIPIAFHACLQRDNPADHVPQVGGQFTHWVGHMPHTGRQPLHLLKIGRVIVFVVSANWHRGRQVRALHGGNQNSRWRRALKQV